MLDLKPYLDAANAASDEVQRLVNAMDAAFKLGTDEGTNQALAMRPQLDEAKAKADEADKLYRSMRNASITDNNTASRFAAPIAVPTQTGEDNPDPKVMKRADFNALTHPAWSAFMRSGGAIEA